MASTETLTVTLPTELARTVRASVESGEYPTTNEILREALDDWSRQRADGHWDVAALREAVRIGDESGPSIPAEQVYAELRAVIDEYRVQTS